MRVNDDKYATVEVSETRMEQADRYICLGSVLTEDWASEQQVRSRITMAKGAFNRKRRIWYSRMN